MYNYIADNNIDLRSYKYNFELIYDRHRSFHIGRAILSTDFLLEIM